ncbi:hypothetical protein [Bacillus glycinifermentans]|uniref:Inner spore coat protein n=2 Tax=Bacillus glycinifermentans TaxID=1664069 RepID=A0ABU6H6S1_9BACI|nr:hypothetical protein [Bacillus glycinifermentans]MEC0486319.1 hypothetical protein [Bacillus glycinifermentans]MEC0493373.1 hypothetical protein [Bacillus glycinifermentans]MEC0541542.1 hypothetical protein [Bacillus glycinifermentans]MEC3606183.1 hypothetical protein [Bacillus glycinifermentans]
MESKKTDGVAERNRGANTEKNAKRYCVCFILKNHSLCSHRKNRNLTRKMKNEVFSLFPCYIVNAYWACPYRHVHDRQLFPEVKTDVFLRSARTANSLMADGQLILNRITASRDLARRIMEAGQRSQKETVIALLRQTGIRSRIDVSFNPDGLRIILINPSSTMSLMLRWS